VAPRNAVEACLAEIWSEVLHVEHVGVNDDFFALGGDSILSVRILWRTRQAGFTFTLEDIFQHRSIAGLARLAFAARPADEARAPAFALLSAEEAAALSADPAVEDAYPLAVLQAGMRFHSELSPASAVYHDIFSVSVQGTFEPDVFERAADALVQRHPILRTSFRAGPDGRLLQAVAKHATVAVAITDITDLSETEQERFLIEWMERDKAASFDWSTAPLIRFAIHLRGAQRIQYTLSFQHAILDGWSVAALQTELFEIYGRLLSGQEVERPALRSLYRHFIALEQRALLSEESREYWRRSLEGVTPQAFAALDRKPRGPRGERLDVCALQVDPELHADLAMRARQLNVPLKSVLLAAHVKVMALFGGQHDLVCGVVSNGRLEEEDGDRALGLYLNSLPMRVVLRDGTWGELVREVHELEQRMLPHRRFPLHEIQQTLQKGPLFDALFNYNHFHLYEGLLSSPHVKLGEVRSFEQTSFGLVVTFSRVMPGEGLSLSLAFDEAVLDRGQVERIMSCYARALRELARSIGERHSRTSLLGEDDRALLEGWSSVREEYPRGALVQELFEAQAAVSGEGTAVVFGGEELSYAQLDRRASQVAYFLRERGVGPDDRVGVYVERGMEMVVGVLGILKAGAAYVPVDPGYPQERVAYMMQDAAPRMILTLERLKERLPAGTAPAVSLDGQWGQIAGSVPTGLQAAQLGLQASHLAYVIYTSGSTGQPKGVAMPHAGLVNLIEWHRRHLSAAGAERTLQFAALGFDVAFQEIFTTLCTGGTLVLIEEERRRDPRALLEYLCEQRVERLFLPFSALQALAEYLRDAPHRPLPPLREVITAGEQLRIGAGIRSLFRRLGGCRLYNQYGPTESHVVTALTLAEDPQQWPELPAIGRPVPNTRIYILDALGQPVPIGVAGEIHIGGVALARGYLNRAALTQERFVMRPGLSGQEERLYRSGDVGRYRPDGSIEFLGRNDQQVKIRGYRVEPGEVEARLSEHALVKEAAVIAQRSPSAEQRLVAYLTAAGEEQPRAAQLREYLQERLPPYMVPSAFVVLQAMPLTPNGKLDRQALPDPHLDDHASESYEPPQGEAERVLADLWQGLLQLDRVGRRDNFFDLGGHSLLAM
ncbi:MAG: amino acid adenylation domain-containing protein, partial [Steroidobacteraceae bacterium]